MPHVPSDEVRPLNLEQQKKRAKELSRALAAGDPQALDRCRSRHPKARGLTDESLISRLAKVSEAQLVIARELGLSSWPRLKEHIERHAAARAEIAAGASALDGDLPTTHVRCGTDIRHSLTRAGLTGEFLEFFDPYCQGPLPRDGDLLEVRARFAASAYGLPLPDARADLTRQMDALAASLSRERVVLWFEHDTFDQLILARILAFYAEHRAPRRLELVQVNRFPGVDRFRGLGELSAAALRMLWNDRRPVRPAMLAAGTRCWNALRDPSPVSLLEAARASDDLPEMGPALVRHLQELPWRDDGLSLTERRTLELVADGPATAGDVFAWLDDEREAVHLGLGDTMFRAILDRLVAAESAPIEVTPPGPDTSWHQWMVTITGTGRHVLGGDLDWLRTAPVERWVGGVRVGAGAPDWRWDPSLAMPLLQRGG